MKRRDLIVYIVGGALAVALIAFSAMRLVKKNDVAPPPAAPVAAAPASTFTRMPLAELQQHLQRNDVTLIDVRDIDSYIAGHIPSAIHIPLSYIEGEIPYLPKDKPIVTYCSCPAEETSGNAAMILGAHSIQASALLGGYREWVAQNLPVHTGRQP